MCQLNVCHNNECVTIKTVSKLNKKVKHNWIQNKTNKNNKLKNIWKQTVKSNKADCILALEEKNLYKEKDMWPHRPNHK